MTNAYGTCTWRVNSVETYAWWVCVVFGIFYTYKCKQMVINSSDAGTEYSGMGTIPSLAPKVARAPAGMILTVWDRQHVLMIQR